MSVDALGLLQDPVRRGVYEYVAATAEPVARADVARALGLGLTLVAFHLDKLAAAGLLDVSFARRSGRAGPGAGRPAKLYQRSTVEHVVSVPPRDYGGLADALATAVAEAGVEDAAYAAARDRGLLLAARRDRSGPATADTGAEPQRTLAALGYEPYRDGAVLRFTVAGGLDRLALLERAGASAQAFTLREPYPSPGVLVR
ncbi:MAG TPA: helix-turn-helix domain-containing protein [Micromonosporaceae bacterium]|nr:helix-turn-helix domain-containing protein [Micromonosporaceae bacterium]